MGTPPILEMRKLRLRETKITSMHYRGKIGALSCSTLKPVLFSLAVPEVWHDFRQHSNIELNNKNSLYTSIKILLFFSRRKSLELG